VLINSFCAFQDHSIKDRLGVTSSLQLEFLLSMLELKLLDSILLISGKFLGFILGESQLLDFGLVKHFQMELVSIFLVLKFSLLLSQVVLHLSISNPLLIHGFLLGIVDLQLLGVHFSLLLLNSKLLVSDSFFPGFVNIQLLLVVLSFLLLNFESLFSFEDGLFGSCLSLNSGKFSLSNKGFLSDSIVDFTTNLFSVLSTFFSEFCLKISEQTS